MNNKPRKGGDVIQQDISCQEAKLLDFFRHQLQYGEARVIVKDGQPVFVRIAFRDVKLD